MDSLYFDTFEENEPSDEPSSLEELGLTSFDGLEHLLCRDCKSKRPRRVCQNCHESLLAAKRSGKLFKSTLETLLPSSGSRHGQAEPFRQLGLRRLPLSENTPSTPSPTRNQSESSIHIETVETLLTNFFGPSATTSQSNGRSSSSSSFWDSPFQREEDGQETRSSPFWEPQGHRTRRDTRSHNFWDSGPQSEWHRPQHDTPSSSFWDPVPQNQWPRSQNDTPSSPFWESHPQNNWHTLSPPLWESTPQIHHQTTIETTLQWNNHDRSQPVNHPVPSRRLPRRLQPQTQQHRQDQPPPYTPTSTTGPPPPYSPSPLPLPRICSNPYCLPQMHIPHHLLPIPIPFPLNPQCPHSLCLSLYRSQLISSSSSPNNKCPDPFYCHNDSAWDDLNLDHPWFIRELFPRQHIHEVTRYNRGERMSLTRREVGQTLLLLSIGRAMFPRRIWIVDCVSVGLRKWFLEIITWPWRSIKEVVGMILGEGIIFNKENNEDDQLD
ncbi:hypothetical protein QBC38DRAFT_247463 [Podospora fimiseda]|uniref:Uncharacterized protein n=1 Tax=Podospora fimiseda TaxID=252190 RepID=A0AAN7H7Q0_9PEZI|nr:hypothetical protein QBC38DRAFT_247463 [Podospora fimiseda]